MNWPDGVVGFLCQLVPRFGEQHHPTIDRPGALAEHEDSEMILSISQQA